MKKFVAKRSVLGAFAIWVLFAAPWVLASDLTPGYWDQTPLPQTGLATFYASGMMEYVEGYRQSQSQLPVCPECVGTVALLRAGDIGRKVWLQPPNGERVGPFLVIDCARRQDVDPLLDRGWVVDVSYQLGQVWGMNRPLDAVTVLEDPADATAGPVRLGVPTPFFVPPGEVVISAPTPTPEFVVPAPTSWPTRIPDGLRLLEAEATPAWTPEPPTPILPPPLTPIVTTPTPDVTPTPPLPIEASATEQVPPVVTEALMSGSPTPESPVEVSVGRAGGGLLEPASVLTPAPVAIWPTPTGTLRPPVRTPRPDLTPILPPVEATPTPTVQPDSSFSRFWRDVLDRVLP